MSHVNQSVAFGVRAQDTQNINLGKEEKCLSFYPNRQRKPEIKACQGHERENEFKQNEKGILKVTTTKPKSFWQV